ncbi:Uncharacterised protein [Legionella wadsworthii]|uniref:Uncharacterized protein n=2 Tax=Legionella wadsworthii TaxID=28088 RepID=A0A378LRW6_9GAMM|nr:Uncharacterised protein [Legionella wadsworthii]
MLNEHGDNISRDINESVSNLVEQNQRYLKDLLHFSSSGLMNPTEFYKNSLNLFIKNTNYFLEYMQNIFSLMEKFPLTMSYALKEQNKGAVDKLKNARGNSDQNDSKSSKKKKKSRSNTDAHAQLTNAKQLHGNSNELKSKS